MRKWVIIKSSVRWFFIVTVLITGSIFFSPKTFAAQWDPINIFDGSFPDQSVINDLFSDDSDCDDGACNRYMVFNGSGITIYNIQNDTCVGAFDPTYNGGDGPIILDAKNGNKVLYNGGAMKIKCNGGSGWTEERNNDFVVVYITTNAIAANINVVMGMDGPPNIGYGYGTPDEGDILVERTVYFELTVNNENPNPGEKLRYKVSWNNSFTYPDQVNYIFWFPYGKSENNFCGTTGNECPTEKVVLVDGVAQPDGLTGSGAYNFTWAYQTPGTFNGALVLSSDCDLTQLLHDTYNECDTAYMTREVTVKDIVLGTNGEKENPVNQVYANGGTSGTASGFYLATNKQVYQKGEPVFMKWYFNMGSIIVDSVKIFNGSGSQLVATLTGSTNISNNIAHYATIYYNTAGIYQPYIRLCIGDCTTTFVDIYIGGGSGPSASYAITVTGTIYSGAPDSIPFTTCTSAGIFGYNAEYFTLNFTSTGSSAFVRGIQNVGNQGIQSFVWLASNVFCTIGKAPIISTLTDVIAPVPGTYTLPKSNISTEWYARAFDIFPFNTYTISYDTSEAGNEFWSIAIIFINIAFITWFVIDSI